MLNILDFSKYPSYDLKLGDGKWQFASVADLNTTSVFWNRAALITLSKEYTIEAPSALIYLLQKEANALGLWAQEWGNLTPDIGKFIKSLEEWGRFTNPVGYTIPIDEFWKSYTATIEGIISEPSFEYQEEGLTKSYVQHLVKGDIHQVICFDDKWNEQHFFIETSKEWLLFTWMTMA